MNKEKNVNGEKGWEKKPARKKRVEKKMTRGKEMGKEANGERKRIRKETD